MRRLLVRLLSSCQIYFASAPSLACLRKSIIGFCFEFDLNLSLFSSSQAKASLPWSLALCVVKAPLFEVAPDHPGRQLLFHVRFCSLMSVFIKPWPLGRVEHCRRLRSQRNCPSERRTVWRQFSTNGEVPVLFFAAKRQC